ncbi:hypothetical protein KIPB_007631, partial [Kipferlia bialata]
YRALSALAVFQLLAIVIGLKVIRKRFQSLVASRVMSQGQIAFPVTQAPSSLGDSSLIGLPRSDLVSV